MKTFGGKGVFTVKFFCVIAVLFVILTLFVGSGVVFFYTDKPVMSCSSVICVNETDSTAYCVVDNAETELDLNKHLLLSDRIKANVFCDVNCEIRDEDNVLVLAVGDNVFYVEIKNIWGKSRLYELTIRRKPMYIVTFDSDGGTPVNERIVMEGEYLSPEVSEKVGYDFAYWDYDFGQKITRDITTKAIWAPKEMRIKYNPNGGTGEECFQTVRYKESIKLFSSDRFSRTGYTFSGWNTKADGTGDSFSAGEEINQFLYTYNVELFAQWSINKYDVSCENNIPEAGTISGLGEYNYGSRVELLASSNDGFTWDGWYDETGNKLSEDVKLEITFLDSDYFCYAKWNRNKYSLTLNPNNGVIEDSTKEVVFGENYILPIPTREEAEFCGWMNESGELMTDKFGNSLSAWSGLSNETLYAQWIVNQYNVDAETEKTGCGSVTGLGSKEYGSEVTITAKPNDGYKFTGWYDGITLLTQNETYSFIMPNKNVKHTAKFEVRGYIANLDVFGGNELDAFSVEVFLNKVFKLPVPERTGYTFGGWYLGSVTNGRKITDNTGNCLEAWNIKTDVTLYAKWVVEYYTITYNLNGGTLQTKNRKTYSVESGEIIINNPILGNYVFDGWIGTGIDGKEMNLVISSGSVGDREYYASWKEGNEFKAISTTEEFLSIAENLTGCYYLTQDIDLSGVNFNGFGDASNPFSGIFDGKGYSLLNLGFTNSSLGSFRGLFHTNNGTIKNLKLANFSLVGIKKHTGAICFNNNGVIEQVVVSASVTVYNNYSYGGIVLKNFGKIRNCYTTGTAEMSGTSDRLSYCGGIVSENGKDAEITNCYSCMTIQTNGYAGGIVGNDTSEGKITNCFFAGSINSTDLGKAGAITSKKEDSNAKNCYYLNSNGVVVTAEAYKSSVGMLATEEELKTLVFIGFGEYLTADNLWINPTAVWKQTTSYPRLYWED